MKKLFTVVMFLLLTFSCFAKQDYEQMNNACTSENGSQSAKLFQTLVSFDDVINIGKTLSLIRCDLVYYGYDQGRISFKQNEYLSNIDGLFTVPGYSETLEYNIRDNRVIDYKGIKLYIIQANDQNLTYKILTNEPEGKFVITQRVK